MEDRRRRVLVNKYEAATDRALAASAANAGLRVFPKVRIADAIRIESSGLSADEYRYALQGHFDFVVADEATSLAEFAVEYDGPGHATDTEAITRDALKGRICEALGLALVRVDAGYLRQVGGFVLVGWLAEVWAAHRWFVAAQAAGEIDFMEPWDHQSVLDDSGRARFWLSGRARRRLFHLANAGLLWESFWVPETVSHWDHESTDGYSTAYSLVRLADGRVVIGEGRCKVINFEPVSSRDLAVDLAVVELVERVDAVVSGVAEPATGVEIRALRKRTATWLREGRPLDD